MSYHHIDDELPDGVNSGEDFYNDTRNNLNDIWRKMVYSDNVMYLETQVNDITNTAADAGTVGVYITDGAAPGWDIFEHVLLEEFCPKVIVYRRKINYADGSSPHEFIRKIFTWSQEGGTAYKRLIGVDFEFSLSGVDDDYTDIGYAELTYQDTTDHRLSAITWYMPELSKYWFYQSGKPVSSDSVVQVLSDIKKNISALRDLQVFGGVVGWDNNYAQGESQPVVPFVPGWDMTATLKSKFADPYPDPDVNPAQSVSRIDMTDQTTGAVVRADFTWSQDGVDAVTAIAYDYSPNGVTFYSTHNVALTYQSTSVRAVTATTHTLFTVSYDHYDPDKPSNATGAATITAIQQNMEAVLHCRLFVGGMGHTWVSAVDPNYTETFPMISNVPNWELQGITSFDSTNEIQKVNYKHKINTAWELNRFVEWEKKTCTYFYTEEGTVENDNTRIAVQKYNPNSSLYLAKVYARCILRGDCPIYLYDFSSWTLFGEEWVDLGPPAEGNLHIVANDQHDVLLWANHAHCVPVNNTNAITTELIDITSSTRLKIVLSGNDANMRGNWITKNAAGTCISGDPFDTPGTTYIERGLSPGFQTTATHIMICYTFEYDNEVLEVYDDS